jgi:hypothetical protein
METKYLGSTLALAVAGLIASASLSANAGDAPAKSTTASTMTVRCMGINSCKGTGACSTATNSCHGANSCKGKGVTMVATEKECTDKKGTVATVEKTTTPTTTTAPAAPTPPATPPAK